MKRKKKSSAIVEDYNDNHLEILNEITTDIKDPEIRARIADVLWIRKKDFGLNGQGREIRKESSWPLFLFRILRK